jgi:hypothetical protein
MIIPGVGSSPGARRHFPVAGQAAARVAAFPLTLQNNHL